MRTVEPKDIIIHLNGKTFHCEDCGSNVFHKVVDEERPGVLIYECNGCSMWYQGEK